MVSRDVCEFQDNSLTQNHKQGHLFRVGPVFSLDDTPFFVGLVASVQKTSKKTQQNSPKKYWLEYFQKNKPKDSEVRLAVLRLFNNKKYDHVIAFIEAALIQGQARPWMYNVLIGAMEIEKYPVAEIDRIRASAIDLTAKNVPNIMATAAYFKKSGSHSLALRLFRQASQLAPTRPEPYIMGLPLAQELKDVEAIRWAASGILINAWTPDYRQLHEQAEIAAEETIQQLIAQQRIDEAATFRQAIAGSKIRDLVVKLSWSGVGDLDLIVEEPLGSYCSFEFPQSPGGGVLTHDGYGPDQHNCFEEYICGKGFPGKYRIRVRHVHGDIVGKRAILTVIRHHGSESQTVRVYPIQLSEDDAIVRISLPEGRRTISSEVEEHVRLADLETPRYKSFREKIGRPTRNSRRARRRFANSRRVRGGGARPLTGYQPNITLIPEGIFLQTNAVISGDRRFVRISPTPVFQTITDVFTFSFINGGGNGIGGGQGGGGQGGGFGGGGQGGGFGGGGFGGGGQGGGFGGGGFGGGGFGGGGGGFFSVPSEQVVPR